MSGVGGYAPATVRALARTIRSRARRVQNRFRRASVILLYHRVAEGVADPWSLCVTPANFHAQAAVLAGRGVVPLDALADDLALGRRRRALAVTFDDGYADVATTAWPVLRAHAIPTTLFVSTGTLDGGAEFWWDELERIVLGSPALPDSLWIDLGGEPFSWLPTSAGARRQLYFALHQRIGRLAVAVRTRVLADLRDWAGVPGGCRDTHRPLAADEVRALARESALHLGAHGVSHSYLGALPADEQQREIQASKATLEAIAGAPVERFSYPHGDCAPRTVAYVRAAGFRLACGTACAPVFTDADLFDLPRVEVPNLPGPAFARWLDEWVG